MKKCPNCNVGHADYADSCECGFDFKSNAMQAGRTPNPGVGERVSSTVLKALGLLLALIIAFTILGAINRNKNALPNSPTDGYEDKVVIDGLPRLAKQLNEGLPMMVDQQTRTDSVVAGPAKKLTYNMTLVSVGPGDISADQLREQLESKIRTKLCASDEVAGLRSDGVTWGYKYHDNQNNVIAEIVIYPTDCASK